MIIIIQYQWLRIISLGKMEHQQYLTGTEHVLLVDLTPSRYGTN